MLSKAELARLGGISPITLDRIENGQARQLAIATANTARPWALKVSQKKKVFTQ